MPHGMTKLKDIADRGRVNEDKLRQDDEIIEQFGE